MKKIYNYSYSLLLLFTIVTFNVNAQVTASWILLSSGTTTTLSGVSAPSPLVCYVAGYSGLIRKTTDGGLTWTTQTSGTTNNFSSICFTDLLHGYAVGDNGAAVKTSNGGLTWTSITLTAEHLRGLYFFDANTGYITGGNPGTDGLIFKTTDAGATWTSLITTGASTNTIYGIYFTSSNTGYANDYNNNILKTTNGGTSWTKYSAGSGGPMGGSIYFTSATNGIVTGFNGGLHITSDAGVNWSAVTTSSTTDTYSGIDFYDSSNGFIVGGSIANNTATILSTTNGGLAWSSLTPGGGRLVRLDIVNANLGYAVGLNGTILKYTSNVGIAEKENTIKSFNSYPNPFATSTTIDCSNYSFEHNAFVEIYDITGKVVRTLKPTVKENKIILEKAELISGIYFYKIYDGSAMIGTGKMIVE